MMFFHLNTVAENDKMKNALICLVFCVSSAFGVYIAEKCRIEDSKCLTAYFQAAVHKVFVAIPELGVETSDPLYLEKIESVQPSLTAEYSKVTVKGYKDCKVEDVKLITDKFLLSYDLICDLDISGDYKFNGKLLTVPIEGDGKFTGSAKRILLRIETETDQIDGSDGKKHLQYRNFKIDIQALDTVKFNFENLFNGDKQKADEVHKFTNENYKAVVKELGPAFFSANLDKIYKNINQFYLSLPIEDMIISE